MSRAAIFSAVILVFGCACSDDPLTLNGEPVIGGPSDTVVYTIDIPGLPTVFLRSDGNSTGLAIFQSKTGAPYLTITDSDNDGVFDLLAYSSLSEGGETLVDVEDYGMDGQPDFILRHKDSTASVFYEGRWLPVKGIGSGQNTTVLVNGKERDLAEVLAEVGRKAF